MLNKSNTCIFFLMFIFLILIKTENISAKTKHNNIRDTLIYVDERENICFFSNGKYYPFSLTKRPYGYFTPIYKDIEYGFYDKEKDRDKFRFSYTPKNKVVRVTSDSYKYIKEIDTLYNYFSRPRKSEKILDTFNLSRELEYSYLLREINHTPLIKNDNDEELRMIYVGEYDGFVRELYLMRVEFYDESAKIFFTKIDTEIAQDINVVKTDTAWLKGRDLKELREKMNKIDFNKINDLENDNCPDFFYYGGRKFEYLLEYKNKDSYNYTILCDCSSYYAGYPYFNPKNKELRYDLLLLQTMFIKFYRSYFRTPLWQRLWNRMFED